MQVGDLLGGLRLLGMLHASVLRQAGAAADAPPPVAHGLYETVRLQQRRE